MLCFPKRKNDNEPIKTKKPVIKKYSILTFIYDEKFEVIIIDSGSTDKTIEIAKEYPVRLIQIKPEEFGHGKTRNYGADISEGEYLVFLTQDAIPFDNNWLRYLISNLEDENVAGVYNKQIPRR
ncbi:unnamed protein product [marine sediment metagenome]|uniref:Glycosyltransferase 2-like domain-containing protein n=1 Tax=marine sediment metagenome TaxID=412755 RepID=X1QM81_9ZZZZ